MLEKHPGVVVLLFGTNDSVLTAPGRFRVPLDEYENNLREMVRRCRAAGAQVILGTLLPIIPEPYYTRHPKQYYDEAGGLEPILQRYRAAALKVGQSMQVPVVDLYAELGKDLALLRPAPDGVHPSAQGVRKIAELFAAELQNAAQADRPEKAQSTETPERKQ